MVETMLSFAANPEIEAATASHLPNPSGVKIGAMRPPSQAMIDSSVSQRPKVPSWKPKEARNQMITQAAKRMVPTFLR